MKSEIKRVLVFMVASLFFALGVVACDTFFREIPVPNDYSQYETRLLRVGTTDIRASVVFTPHDVERGLSGKLSLPENSGMLFVFPLPDRYQFWMKEMLFPLDMIWIDRNGVIVDTRENLSPDSYPALFTPKEKAQFVLEVNAGFVKKHTLKDKDIIFVRQSNGTFLPL